MRRIILYSALLTLLVVSGAQAHSVEYRIENRGVSARFFFVSNDPVSYSSYEIFGPDDTIPYQKGRTDKNGVAAFLPDRPGKWRIKVIAESDHGGHAATVDVNVDKGLLVDSFSKPLVATYPKLFVSGGLLLSAFGVWALFAARKTRQKEPSTENPPTT